jgi:carboxylesterase
VALHGFGGTPLEVELVVDIGRELGLRTVAPLLPGHGTHARDLAATRFPDWLRAATAAFDLVAGPGRPAFVVGLSMGALLAAHLAVSRSEHVLGLGMLANATRLTSPFPDWPLRALDRLGLTGFSIPKAGPDIADPEARATHVTYGVQPVAGGLEVLRAGERTEKILGKIRCPAFIAHGLYDHVCPVDNAERVASLLGSAEKTVLILPRSFHIATRDYDRDLLRGELRGFIERHLPGEPPAGGRP